MRKVRNQKGFTIMELMIVIVIIGILIAIAVPAYQSFRLRAQTTACNANVRTIQSAAGLYYADQNAYPADISELWDGADDTMPKPGEVYLDEEILCATGEGTISIDDNGVVSCDEHGN